MAAQSRRYLCAGAFLEPPTVKGNEVMCDLAIAPNTKKRIPRYKATTARNGLISKILLVIEGRGRSRIPQIMRRTNGKVIAISLDSRAAINAADAIQTYFALRVLRYRRNINIEQK